MLSMLSAVSNFCRISIFLLVPVPLVSGCQQVGSNLQPSNAGTDDTRNIAAPGFAVVELFTSQGCNSCPPADRVLQTLSEQSQQTGSPVYCLSFHVDYWNNLGWTDPYSEQEFSQRQRDYATAFESERIYTPQMIVNGEHEFVGSESRTANGRIKQALNDSASTVVNLDAKLTKYGEVAVYFRIIGPHENHRLNIAIIQNSASTEVSRGENAGKTLTHANVVRVFETIDLDASGKGHRVLGLPPDLKPDMIAVVGYVQDMTSMRIKGARRIDLNDKQSNQLSLTPQQWRQRLTADEFEIARQQGTEPRNTGADSASAKSGVYTCVGCGAAMFDAATKFESGTGWPSFWKPIENGTAGTSIDRSLNMVRTEVKCERCGAHIGHVFDDGPQPTGQRWCLNSIALIFTETDKPGE